MTFIFFLCSPCHGRYAEFGRAVAKSGMEGTKPRVVYFGVISEKQKDVVTTIEQELFQCLGVMNIIDVDFSRLLRLG